MNWGIIGKGNVGSHLHKMLLPFLPNIQMLPGKDFQGPDSDMDVYLLCLPDQAITSFVDAHVWAKNQVLIHCSGSMELGAIHHPQRAVFYPLQTFSKSVALDYTQFPIFWEADGSLAHNAVQKLLEQLPNSIQELSSESRLRLHLSAVLSCNLSNALWRMAEQQLKQAGLSFDLLKPLLQETWEKAQNVGPGNAQTGPAQRGDIPVLAKHLELLKQEPATRDVYALLSNWIIEEHDNKKL